MLKEGRRRGRSVGVRKNERERERLNFNPTVAALAASIAHCRQIGMCIHRNYIQKSNKIHSDDLRSKSRKVLKGSAFFINANV
jgi:hypothetical protein